MAEPERRKTVVLVEDQAHVLHGHFPKLFAEVAEGFVDAGCEVHVLTSLGWPLDRGEHRFALHRYGTMMALLLRLSPWAVSLTRRTDRRGGLVGHLGRTIYRLNEMLVTVALLVSTRRLIRREGLDPVGIVVLAVMVSPRIIDRWPGPHRWLVKRYLWGMPREGSGADHRSGQVGLFCPAEEVGTEVAGYPMFRINLGVARRSSSASPGQREALGLPAQSRLALLIGSGHSRQDPTSAFDALRDRSDVTTVIIGSLANRLDDAERWVNPPHLVGRFMDPTEIDQYIEAADVVIVSLQPGFPHCSSVVLDAASGGTPVIVSQPSLPARWVEEFGAGEVFDSGSADSLAAAFDRLDLPAARTGMLALRDAMVGEAMARRYLEAFAVLGRDDQRH